MSGDRLPAHLEAAGILRRAEANGGFATVLRKGDPERGSLLLVISSRGRHVASLERVLSFEGAYAWQAVGPAESASSAEIADFLAKRARFDEDSWAIELDIPDPERFIAETTASP
ncbi:MAG: hypothetical protein QOF34_698 [Sphingomonadales bacterium]|nr:hypothetical protein [Sphingomonadales bacterium]